MRPEVGPEPTCSMAAGMEIAADHLTATEEPRRPMTRPITRCVPSPPVSRVSHVGDEFVVGTCQSSLTNHTSVSRSFESRTSATQGSLMAG